jgi:hypothetical protein
VDFQVQICDHPMPMRIRHKLNLKYRDTDAICPAQIVDDISLKECSEQYKQWHPFFRGRENDAQWEWLGMWGGRESLHRRTGELDFLAIIADNKYQGMMLSGPSMEANLAPGKRLLYISNVAAAPWNRRNFKSKPNHNPRPLKDVGKALIGYAITLSQNYGHGGRLGLHSRRTSVNFFVRGCCMSYLGQHVKEPSKHYPWCELSDAGVQFLLKLRS